MLASLPAADGFSDALAYSGTWELRGGEEVVHHVCSPRATPSSERPGPAVSWAGDLVLSTPPREMGG